VISELLWIVGLYAAAAAFAHWIIRRNSGGGRRHYVLVAGNHQMQIEWYIRSLQLFSRRTGTEIGITVVLDRSSDDTGPITERFARADSGIKCVRRDSAEDERAGEAEDERVCGRGCRGQEEAAAGSRVVWVELARKEDLQRLPL